MEDNSERVLINKCVPQVGPQKIVMRQVIGERSKQKTIDVHMCVPRRKPGIEQIIDVFVKRVRITCVDLIHDKVIVRGHFEVKAIYVACLPSQPVHAIEMRRVRFTVDVPIYGARCGMDADASVLVEYVDYDCEDKWRLYKNKYDHGYKEYYDHDCDDDCKPHHKHYDCDDDCKPHHKHYDCDDDCKPHHKHYDCDDDCKPHHKHYDCDDDCKHHHHDHCDDDCKPHHHHHHDHCCAREFDVSIVLRVTAKVLADREVIVNNNYYPSLPIKPKG
ncbi:hypothetical protein SPFL3102_03075 [Sporomusaceae bacterium FL31]|nr:hypothetical protein SPFL3101_00969 [Sporomusaceae bacterium FL31]GCE35239.1 hypothetical protein SPFL3102_03075 [Sporomusaceae bacterium]